MYTHILKLKKKKKSKIQNFPGKFANYNHNPIKHSTSVIKLTCHIIKANQIPKKCSQITNIMSYIKITPLKSLL